MRNVGCTLQFKLFEVFLKTKFLIFYNFRLQVHWDGHRHSSMCDPGDKLSGEQAIGPTFRDVGSSETDAV